MSRLRRLRRVPHTAPTRLACRTSPKRKEQAPLSTVLHFFFPPGHWFLSPTFVSLLLEAECPDAADASRQLVAPHLELAELPLPHSRFNSCRPIHRPRHPNASTPSLDFRLPTNRHCRSLAERQSSASSPIKSHPEPLPSRCCTVSMATCASVSASSTSELQPSRRRLPPAPSRRARLGIKFAARHHHSADAILPRRAAFAVANTILRGARPPSPLASRPSHHRAIVADTVPPVGELLTFLFRRPRTRLARCALCFRIAAFFLLVPHAMLRPPPRSRAPSLALFSRRTSSSSPSRNSSRPLSVSPVTPLSVLCRPAVALLPPPSPAGLSPISCAATLPVSP
ncbi:hypothetical protein DAI22_03g290050 [Oryza sativa Japonica Group]|nr:hypothetical protein DAI22_03g290050 [Oryza sativa Japonica Group]